MAAAGNYRHLARIEVQTPGGLGELPTWSPLFVGVWCSVTPIKAGEQLRAMQLTGTVTHRVRTRYLPGVTAHNRIVLETGPVDGDTGRVFEVRGAYDDDERRRELVLLVEEVTAGVPTFGVPDVVVPDPAPLLSPGGAPLLSPGGAPLYY